EVETVRRGLAPVMEGARFTKVIAHRGDLRWPLAQDFTARLEGKTVEGLGRRAKYLLADLSSGDVLVMHLGMSGSFRVATRRGKLCREAAKRPRHHPVGFPDSHGPPLSSKPPAPFGFDKPPPPRRAGGGAVVARARARAARQRIRRGDARARVQGQEDLAQG